MGITRITPHQVEALLRPHQEPEDTRAILQSVGQNHGSPHRRDPATRTLADIGFSPGDILECVIRHTIEPREYRRTTVDRRRERSPDLRHRRRPQTEQYQERSQPSLIPPPRE